MYKAIIYFIFSFYFRPQIYFENLTINNNKPFFFKKVQFSPYGPKYFRKKRKKDRLVEGATPLINPRIFT